MNETASCCGFVVVFCVLGLSSAFTVRGYTGISTRSTVTAFTPGQKIQRTTIQIELLMYTKLYVRLPKKVKNNNDNITREKWTSHPISISMIFICIFTAIAIHKVIVDNIKCCIPIEDDIDTSRALSAQ